MHNALKEDQSVSKSNCYLDSRQPINQYDGYSYVANSPLVSQITLKRNPNNTRMINTKHEIEPARA
jgi:hypothetical protein